MCVALHADALALPNKPLKQTAAPRRHLSCLPLARGGLPRAPSSLPATSRFADAAAAQRQYVALTRAKPLTYSAIGLDSHSEGHLGPCQEPFQPEEARRFL